MTVESHRQSRYNISETVHSVKRVSTDTINMNRYVAYQIAPLPISAATDENSCLYDGGAICLQH